MTSEVERLFEAAVLECPHAYLGELREQDPVHQIPGTPAFLVSRLDLIKEVVADPARFSSRTNEFLFCDPDGQAGLRPPIGEAGHDEDAIGVLATADPPDHQRHRRQLSHLLSVGAIARREDEYRALVDDALTPALAAGRIEWMSELAEPLPMIMVTRADVHHHRSLVVRRLATLPLTLSPADDTPPAARPS